MSLRCLLVHQQSCRLLIEGFAFPSPAFSLSLRYLVFFRVSCISFSVFFSAAFVSAGFNLITKIVDFCEYFASFLLYFSSVFNWVLMLFYMIFL